MAHAMTHANFLRAVKTISVAVQRIQLIGATSKYIFSTYLGFWIKLCVYIGTDNNQKQMTQVAKEPLS